MKELTLKDFQNAAQKLKTDIASIQAVSEVESRGKAFYDDGFPVILFERHKFHKFTNGEYDKSHPEISNPVAGGYGKAGQHQRDKFNEAFALNPQAAMKSCSWGAYQIMGFNYELCGFTSVGEFVDVMKSGQAAQLQAFVNFILATGLGDELRNHKWALFAQGYNGKDYKINQYDTKLANAYKKFLNQKPVPLISSQENPSVESNPTKTEVSVNDNGITVSTESNETPTETKEVPAPAPYGFIVKIRTEFAALTGINLTLDGIKDIVTNVQENSWLKDYIPFSAQFWTYLVEVVLIVSIVYGAFRLIHFLVESYRKQHTLNKLIDVNADKTKNDVIVKADMPPSTVGESVGLI